MDKNERTIIDKLSMFRTYLLNYSVLRKKLILYRQQFTEEEYHTLASLYETVSIDAGKFALLIKEITGLETVHTSAGQQDIWNWALKNENNKLIISALDNCVAATSRTIGKLEIDIANGIRDAQGNVIGQLHGISGEPPKTFIAHGGKSAARDKLYGFLTALGVTPFIIEEEPKEGRSVNEQVEYYSEQADCAIILGTADDKELKDGKLYPRRNVHIEIGRFQAEFPNRIIYLLEEGASFPSNISEKLYTPFTQESMDEAFIALARELTAFGILKAVKPQQRSINLDQQTI